MNIQATQLHFKNLHHKLQFTIENKLNSTLNFLYLTITRIHNHLQFGIYRNPASTNTLVHSNSQHPTKQKLSGANYLRDK